MITQKILVHGFPHSGTSILRVILGSPSVVEDQIQESLKFKLKTNKPYGVVKWPYTHKSFFSKEYEDYIKVFIIRNPYFSFSSLNRRYGDKRYALQIPQESIGAWDITAKLWLTYQKQKLNDVFTVRYEDLFANDFLAIRSIFDEIGILYTDQVFDTTNSNNMVVPGVKYQEKIPSPISHAQFRTWQINQSFKNMNDFSTIDLSNEQYYELSNLKSVSKLGYQL